MGAIEKLIFRSVHAEALAYSFAHGYSCALLGGACNSSVCSY